MLRPASPEAKDIDVEKSREELDALEGKKATAQTETLAVAEDKKRIEGEKIDLITRLEAEIKEKQMESKRAAVLHLDLIANNKKECEVAENELTILKRAIQFATEEKNAIESEVAGKVLEKTQKSSAIAELTRQEAILKNSLTEVKSHIALATSDLGTLDGQLQTAQKELAKATADRDAAVAAFATERKENEGLTASKEAKQKEIAALDARIGELTKKVSDETLYLSEVEKKRADHEEAMKVRETEANSRLTNATHLETRVDAKLAQLKEAEKEFNVDHLSRIGYKPIGT